jgi:DNA uptake protein ComE-like DNA-binding protein
MNGYFILLILTVLLIVVPYAISEYAPKKDLFTAADRMMLDSLRASFSSPAAALPESFTFDPNTLDADSLALLGLDRNVAQRIENYREKGGSFARKSDLLKIYGLDSAMYNRLEPYVRIAEGDRRHINTRNLNLATPRDLQQLAGIIPPLAGRVVAYGRVLGGYVRMHQLHEVYGADSALVASVASAFFIPDGFLPVRININTAPEEDLSGHPYISAELANSIVLYRSLNGPIHGRQTLSTFQHADDTLIEKLFPYLEF